MVTVAEAEQIILAHTRSYGTELVPLDAALGRILAVALFADRDLPPCNRVTMDGIALRYGAFEGGAREFRVKGIVAAGDAPIEIDGDNECVEIMTGAALPVSTDTIVRYEDVRIVDGIATLTVDAIKKGQNIHRQGRDKKAGEEVVACDQLVDAAVVSMAASVGMSKLPVRKLPRVAIISTGDELVETGDTPTAWQVRHSNKYAISAALRPYGIIPGHFHLPDDADVTRSKIGDCLARFDVILLTGGVSMGKFDYVPRALEDLQVSKHFHKVQQRPGKPFWFGTHSNGACVFAFPGNPVSAFMCFYRYFMPWLNHSLKADHPDHKACAILDRDVTFHPPLQYFMQVQLHINDRAQLIATPVEGNGSGDFANLMESDAFMELPSDKCLFEKDEVYPIWIFRSFVY